MYPLLAIFSFTEFLQNAQTHLELYTVPWIKIADQLAMLNNLMKVFTVYNSLLDCLSL